MRVIQTKPCLLQFVMNKKKTRSDNLYIQQEALCDKLTLFFGDASAYDIHLHLLNHGLFAPTKEDNQLIEAFCKRSYWNKTKKILIDLKNDWDGPEIPVFIFPSDPTNDYLQSALYGFNGLSFHDKCFLFLPVDADISRLKALVTHEYNHICRLSYLDKKEAELNLLDGIVLEGLAEYAVLQRVGEAFLGKWTSLYNLEVAKKHWDKFLSPQLALKKTDTKHDIFMYGKGRVPTWVGYNAGYHLVSSFMEKQDKSMKELLQLPSETILDGSLFATK